MGDKPDMTAEGTYIFDDEQIDQLDEFSLTSVIDEAWDSTGLSPADAEGKASEPDDVPSAAKSADRTIDELLAESDASTSPAPVDRPRGYSERRVNAGPMDPDEVLIAPDLLFPDETNDSS